MDHRLKLISFDLCPYVERSRIVLLEKRVPHEVEYIDLRNKPGWFLALSPMGRVPVLLVDGRPIFESMVINELLEELYPRPELFPKDPIARAEARGWIVFANEAIMPSAAKVQQALATGEEGEALERPRAALAEALGKVEAHLARSGGPFFMGQPFTLVDAALAPFVRRLRAAEALRPRARSALAGRPRCRAYAYAVLAHPSVVEADPGEVGPRLQAFRVERAQRERAGRPSPAVSAGRQGAASP
ncbi:MAG TPA: glutathione S-transferase family protein [Anaeromyxobacteraceae bacterium]|nr:glutathione S-transferase family protein [Anaeromyxobacteraceae bacterium]